MKHLLKTTPPAILGPWLLVAFILLAVIVVGLASGISDADQLEAEDTEQNGKEGDR